MLPSRQPPFCIVPRPVRSRVAAPHPLGARRMAHIMESLNASGSHSPLRPVRVAIRPPDESEPWKGGDLVEWRWVDQQAARWEGLVRRNIGSAVWVPGDRLVRVGSGPRVFSKQTA